MDTALKPAPALIDSAVMRRLNLLAPLTKVEIDAVRAAVTSSNAVPARTNVFEESPLRAGKFALESGWAILTRTLANGRRQILNLVLPGELIGVAMEIGTASMATVSTITQARLVLLPYAQAGSMHQLTRAYALNSALHEHYLLRHIARLGQMNAYERVADWLCEIGERLEISGTATRGNFPLPLTQEMLADTLGMTGVHLNRTLQKMRSDGIFTLRDGRVTILDWQSILAMVEPSSIEEILTGRSSSSALQQFLLPFQHWDSP